MPAIDEVVVVELSRVLGVIFRTLEVRIPEDRINHIISYKLCVVSLQETPRALRKRHGEDHLRYLGHE